MTEFRTGVTIGVTYGVLLTAKWHREPFWGDDKILHLDLDSNYTGVYIGRNLPNCTQDLHTISYISYISKKSEAKMTKY